MQNFDRLRWIVEELCHRAREAKNWQKAEAYAKVLDEMIDLEKKYREQEHVA